MGAGGGGTWGSWDSDFLGFLSTGMEYFNKFATGAANLVHDG